MRDQIINTLFTMLFGLKRIVLIAILLLSSACSSTVLIRDPDFLLVRAGKNDTAETLAARYLGDPELSWRIEELNEHIHDGALVLAPRRDLRPTGITPEGIHVVPIITYHQLSPNGHCPLLTVCMKRFEEQIAYLKENDYHVVDLEEFANAIESGQRLAPKSIVVTFDDGWDSVFDLAYPVLADAGIPGTVFVYTDFVGSNSAINWREARALRESGVIDVQSHSKSHPNLVLKSGLQGRGGSLKSETAEVRDLLSDKLGGHHIFAFAYPYGAANKKVVDSVKRAGYDIGLTVTRGANPVYTHPFLIKRTMMYGSDSLSTFKKRVRPFYERDLQ